MGASRRVRVWLYRASGGRLASSSHGLDVVLVTAGGRTAPLAALHHGGDLHVVATAPDELDDVRAHPDVLVRAGAQRFAATAVPLEGEQRDAVYVAAVQRAQRFADLQNRVGRVLPVVRLDPAER